MLAALLLAARCTLPTLTDGYIGFTVGQPDGWTLDYAAGVIEVRRDPATVAIVFPVSRASGPSAQEELAASLSEAARSRGDALHVRGTEIDGTVGGVAVRGRLTRTAGVIRGGWAPSDRWEATRPTIEGIADCFRPGRGTALVSRTKTGSDAAGSTTWGFLLPEGWTVSGATSRGVDLTLDGRNGVSFGYLTGIFGAQTAEGFASFVISSAGHRDVRVLAARDLPVRTDALGLRWSIRAIEYQATLHGRPVRAVLTAAVTSSWGTWSGMAALRVADLDRWDALAAVGAVVQESIRIADAKPGRGLRLPANRPNDVELPSRDAASDDRIARGWESAMLGYDEARSPSTGETWLMPLGAWNETGSDGAGYYRPLPGGGSERLEVDP